MADPTREEELYERDQRQKELDAITATAMKKVLREIAGRMPRVASDFSYGASAINARHLVTWYLFGTDADWEVAQQNGLVADIDRLTREALTAGGYPGDGALQMHVSFTSDETIKRETGGDYWAYFK